MFILLGCATGQRMVSGKHGRRKSLLLSWNHTRDHLEHSRHSLLHGLVLVALLHWPPSFFMQPTRLYRFHFCSHLFSFVDLLYHHIFSNIDLFVVCEHWALFSFCNGSLFWESCVIDAGHISTLLKHIVLYHVPKILQYLMLMTRLCYRDKRGRVTYVVPWPLSGSRDDHMP